MSSNFHSLVFLLTVQTQKTLHFALCISILFFVSDFSCYLYDTAEVEAQIKALHILVPLILTILLKAHTIHSTISLHLSSNLADLSFQGDPGVVHL